MRYFFFTGNENISGAFHGNGNSVKITVSGNRHGHGFKCTFLVVLLPLALWTFLFQVMVRDGELEIGKVDLT